MTAPPSFSVVVIARNEGRALPRLFASATSFLARGGELLVVDTGSTDDTVAVARAHGARVVQVGERFASVLTEHDAARIDAAFARAGEGPLVRAGDRLFHFGDARQHAGSLAGHDHVLQTDAGDEFLALDVDFVERIVLSPEPVRLEYRLRLGDVSLWISRFYDRRSARWEGRVHEALFPSGVGAPGVVTVRADDGDLQLRHHRNAATPRGYLAGLALDALAQPEKARWLHYLGRELSSHGWRRSAVVLLDVHAARSDAWVAERSESLCLAGAIFEALGEVGEAEHRYRQAIALDPTRREPHLRQAALHLRQGDLESSVAHARQALEIGRTSGFAEADANYGHAPHSLLYWGLFWLGRRAEARAHWEVCRNLAPGDPDIEAHAALFGQRSFTGGKPARAGRRPADGFQRSGAATRRPRVSIVTSVYDGATFIEGFLADIVQQSIFPQCELILVNPASPGSEDAFIRAFMDEQPNVLYARLDEDPGLYAVWNMAIREASAEFVTNANVDDRRNPEILEIHARALDEHPDVDLVYSSVYVTDCPDDPFEGRHQRLLMDPPEFLPERMYQCLPGPQPMWRRSLHDRHGYFREDLRSAGDFEMWLRAVSGGAVFRKVPGVAGVYYRNPRGLSTDPARKALVERETAQIIRTYGALWRRGSPPSTPPV